jgi:hypothetical protein
MEIAAYGSGMEIAAKAACSRRHRATNCFKVSCPPEIQLLNIIAAHHDPLGGSDMWRAVQAESRCWHIETVNCCISPHSITVSFLDQPLYLDLNVVSDK